MKKYVTAGIILAFVLFLGGCTVQSSDTGGNEDAVSTHKPNPNEKSLEKPLDRYFAYHQDKIYMSSYRDDEENGFIFKISLEPRWYKNHARNDISQLQNIADDMVKIKDKCNVKDKMGIKFNLSTDDTVVAESDDVTGTVHFTDNK